MKDWKTLCLLLGWMMGCLPLWSQVPDEAAPATAEVPMPDGAQFGIRFGYQLQMPSKNIVYGQNFEFFNAGHHLGYGAYVNLKAGERVQFSPYLGLEHVFWPKSGGYSQACDADSFPTFMAVDDSLPGRNFRFYNVVLEPAFRIYSRKTGLWIKLQPMLAYNIQRKVEQYNHSCGVPASPQMVDYTPSDVRDMSRFTFSLGGGIVKEVHFANGSGLALEPGMKVMLSRLLHVEDGVTDGIDFSLYPWGFYLNLSFVRG